MTTYGFLIDQRKCIGCHACTVACKQEHDIPLGSFRTWVKYVDEGQFPDTQRHFSVMRCNHCERPPCVEICPVTALYKRSDGIVDFDPEACIGCKGCLQACPYDALYIHPEQGAAHKCNFCAHRVEAQREPACVTVCPEQAIVVGDLDNPSSIISQLLAHEPTSVRTPEKGTRPKLYYIDGAPASLDPQAAPPRAEYMWSQSSHPPRLLTYTADELEQMARRTYDIGHETPWGAKVSAYLVTKALAAGCMLVPIVLCMMHSATPTSGLTHVGALAALVALLITTGLLVADLKRPHKFLSILLRPQRKSWLVKGSYILIGYGGVLCSYLGAALLYKLGFSAVFFEPLQALALIPALPLGVLTACYTAWLLRQCEARDLWHAPSLAGHLTSQAVLAGAAFFASLPTSWICPGHPLDPSAPSLSAALHSLLALTLLADLAYFFPAELGLYHRQTRACAQAARIITHGALRQRFWIGVVLLGHLLPLALLWLQPSSAAASLLAGLAALGGLALYEDLFIQAGQAVPLS
jgi:Fe-S-cluster-containing dehydrogenase component/formate-dependent nitrite reductase membrane component NrfD